MSLMLTQSPAAHTPPVQTSRRLSVGTAAKTRTCVHCGRSFRRTEHLERHVRTHTKEKPYTCYCGAAFSRRDLLKRHMGITGHEDTNPPNKNSSPRSQHRTDHDTKQRIRRASASTAAQRRKSSISASVSGSSPQDANTMPPSPEDAEFAQWSMHQNAYMKQDNGLLDSVTEGAHDPEILEAAHLLLPNGLPHGLSGYSAAQHSPPTTAYIPEEPHHYEEFSNFLDSISGLPIEWSGSGNNESHHGHNTSNNSSSNNSYPSEVAEPGLHPLFRERERDRSRGNSPFRSWLPDHHQGSSSSSSSYGMVSEYGNFHHYYHPPEDIARVIVPNF
ncbi:hypothetical protein BDV18DRAFT_132941 [Aspergillus unguis]